MAWPEARAIPTSMASASPALREEAGRPCPWHSNDSGAGKEARGGNDGAGEEAAASELVKRLCCRDGEVAVSVLQLQSRMGKRLREQGSRTLGEEGCRCDQVLRCARRRGGVRVRPHDGVREEVATPTHDLLGRGSRVAADMGGNGRVSVWARLGVIVGP